MKINYLTTKEIIDRLASNFGEMIKMTTKEMLLELRKLGLSNVAIANMMEKEAKSLGWGKGLSPQRIGQLMGEKQTLAGSGGVYDRAIANLYKRICK